MTAKMDNLGGYVTVDVGDDVEDDDDDFKVELASNQSNKIVYKFLSLSSWSFLPSPNNNLTGFYSSNLSSNSSPFYETFDNINLTNLSSLPESKNETWVLPIYMQFNEGHKMAIIVYSILMVISALGNITVLVTIIRLRMKTRLNRVNLFLLHLAIADLLVTFLLMPLEISWHYTVSWRGGDFACRIMSFFRIFGLYLSGFLLVCISLDRYFAVLKPLALPEANKRGRIMLYVAWTTSFICSLPQAWIFHVERHPKAQWYKQCVTYNFFSSPATELAYSISGFILLYGFPLTMILVCYSCILYEIFKINNVKRGTNLRRSNMGVLGRAKTRTLKMTVMIVTAFFCCWTPYNIMSLWYWIDRESAMQLDQRIQKGFFLFACTNSAVNPVVYGFFHIRTKKPAMPVGSNNGRLHRPDVDKGSYKARVKWQPRSQCLCSTSNSKSSEMNSSSTGVRRTGTGLSPRHEVNGPQNPNHLCGHYNNPHSPNPHNKNKSRHNNINAPRKSRRVKFVDLQNKSLPFFHDSDYDSDSGRATGSAPTLTLFDSKIVSIHPRGHKTGNWGFSFMSSSSYHFIPNSHQGNSDREESHSSSLRHSQSHSGLTEELEVIDIDMDSNVGTDHELNPKKRLNVDHIWICYRGIGCKKCHQGQSQSQGQDEAHSKSLTSPISSSL